MEQGHEPYRRAVVYLTCGSAPHPPAERCRTRIFYLRYLYIYVYTLLTRLEHSSEAIAVRFNNQSVVATHQETTFYKGTNPCAMVKPSCSSSWQGGERCNSPVLAPRHVERQTIQTHPTSVSCYECFTGRRFRWTKAPRGIAPCRSHKITRSFTCCSNKN